MPVVNDAGYLTLQQILQADTGSFYQGLFGGPVAEKGGQGRFLSTGQGPFAVAGGFCKQAWLTSPDAFDINTDGSRCCQTANVMGFVSKGPVYTIAGQGSAVFILL